MLEKTLQVAGCDAAPFVASVFRGEFVENRHHAHVAVVSSAGTLLASFGDPNRLTLIRSTAKPAQALAIAETGALERFGFSDADLALMCGSHSSEPMHLARARALLEKVGLQESDLRCGGHPPISEAVNREWIRTAFVPGPICSNCSGKHIGMLAAARALGLSVLDYHLPSHPVQARVRQALARVTGLSEADIGWAIDGCNLPTPVIPLDRLALMYARFAAAADGNPFEDARFPPNFMKRLADIFRAMTSHPELVAGSGRFCTQLMRTFGDRLVGKVGADASYAIGVRTGFAGRVPHPIGIAVKIEDGNSLILQAVVLEVLRQLGIGTEDALPALRQFNHAALNNTVGLPVGHLELSIPLMMR
jgi:L-asparaginase II